MSGTSDGADMTPAPRTKRVTIRDVARLSHTSISTVSAAFSETTGVAEDTRARVLEAANQLGWRPDRRASMLRRNKSTLVGVIYEVEQSFQASLVDSIYVAAREHKLEVFLAGATTHHSEIDCLRLLLGERCSALILTGSTLDEPQQAEAALRIPTLSLCRSVDAPRVDSVTADAAEGARLAIDHLVGLGHQRILYVNGAGSPMAETREHHYRLAMTRAGLAKHIQVIQGGATLRAGVQAAQKIMALPQLPTAVSCFNDMSANAVVRALRLRDIRIPEQISVVGYDDAPIATDPLIALTTIRQPADDMAKLALAILAERISLEKSADPGEEIRHSVDVSLIIRDTTGPAPKRYTVKLRNVPDGTTPPSL